MRPYHVLVAVDGSEASDRAVDWAAEEARCHDAPLTVVHVTERGSLRVPPGIEEYERLEHVRLTEQDLLRSAAERIVDQAADRARQSGPVKVQTTVRTGDPATAIAAAAEDLGANLVVLGCRGLSGLPGMMLGSVYHRMLHTMDRGAVLAVH